MIEKPTYPYTLEVILAQPTGHFHWAIRRKGKLVQRSDRAYVGERNAEERGLAEIQRLLHGADERR